MSDYIEKEEQFGVQNYLPLPVVLSRGEGVWLWDEHGTKFLDMMSAYSAVGHGHCHPELVSVMRDQVGKLCITSRAFHTDKLGAFLEKICTLSGLEKALPMNTGAEAVETAIKAARLWGYKVKNIPDGEAEIIVAHNNFHGRTTTITGFSSEALYKDGFGPFTAGFSEIPFGDADALEKAITPRTCAFLVEPMQGEAGIIIPPRGWLAKVSEICKKHNVLLVLDEVQTGLGRTGAMFAFMHENILPDLLILGKALGGGMMPVSAVVGKAEVMELFSPGSHGSTFGGNPLAAAVGLKALEILECDDLAKRSEQLGEYFMRQLGAIDSVYIKEVRGSGLWIGVEIDSQKASARLVCEKLMEKGVLCKETHEIVVRFAPPLVIEKAEIDMTVTALTDVLKKME